MPPLFPLCPGQMGGIMKDFRLAVERADLILYLSACQAATGQAQFYSSAAEQRHSILFIHRYMVENYRPFVPLMLLLSINDFNRQRILFELLRAGAPTAENSSTETARATQKSRENQLIRYGLRQLPVHRVYKLFAALAQAGVHNRRTRSSLQDYLTWRNNEHFDAVKYRRLMRQLGRHFHLKFAEETHRFLFSPLKRKFKTELYELYRQAQYSSEAALQLPASIAEGFAAARGISRQKWLAQAPLSAQERLRLQESARREKVELKLDPTSLELTQYLLYILGLAPDLREAQRETLQQVIRHQLQKSLPSENRTSTHPLQTKRFQRPALLLDNSYSSWGARSTKQRPLAVALGVYYLFQALYPQLQVRWTAPVEDPLMQQPRGSTALADGLIDLFAAEADAILIVSDGCENEPPGGVTRVLQAAPTLCKKMPWLLHLNPVLNPYDFQPQSLIQERLLRASAPDASVPKLLTLGIRKAEDLFELIAFADFVHSGDSAADFWRRLAQGVAEGGP